MRSELRFAARGLRRAKAFAFTAVLTLALGISGTTLMFALIRGVLLRPLPVHQQDRLIVAWKELRTSGSAIYPFGDTQIDAVARASTLLDGAAGVDRNGVARSVVVDGGAPMYANIGLVTGGFFDVLGVRPVVGRAFTPADDKEGAENVIVISSGLWQRAYGRSPDVIGHRVRIDEAPFTIIGVIPPDLDYPAGIDIWRTTASVPADGPFGAAARREVNLIARMRPGVTLTQAAAEITALSERVDAGSPPEERDAIPVVRSFTEIVVGDARPMLLALFAAMGLVLAIAIANVGNLFLMRGESRRTETALRVALGASRARLVTSAFAESAAVSSIAGVIAFATVAWLVRRLLDLAPSGLPRLDAIRIDGMVALFSTVATLSATFSAGLLSLPPRRRCDLATTLRGAGHGLNSASGNRGRRALVVLQVALAVTVASAAGLLVRSVLRLQAIELGIPADRLILLDLYVPPAALADTVRHAEFLERAMAQLEALPSVRGATPVNVPPFLDRGWDAPSVTLEGQGRAAAAANPSLNLESIHPNYFATLEIPILRGRPFTPADRDNAVPVAIVSEDVAATMWPGADAIGRRLKLGSPSSTDVWRTVVGVAATSRYRTLTKTRPTLYLPAAQFQMTATNLVVRTSQPMEALTSSVAARLRAVDPGVRLMRVVPFTAMLNRPLARPRFNALLLAIFAAGALLLAAVGLYAVMAAHVRQRDREMAIRLTLGATTADVSRLVLGEVARLAGLGGLAGLAASFIAGRLLRSLLFEISPADPATVTAATLSLIAVSALGAYVPLRRCTRVDPAATLRTS